jgi:hypothetical protein
MARAKPTSKRGNVELHVLALALSEHPWNNSVADRQALENVVTQLGQLPQGSEGGFRQPPALDAADA